MTVLAAVSINGLKISLTSVALTYDAFRNNFPINLLFKIYLKDSCGLDFDQHLSFSEIALIERYLQNSQADVGATGTNWSRKPISS